MPILDYDSRGAHTLGPSSAMMMGCGAAAGLLSGASWLLDLRAAITWLPGAVYGVAIMLPFVGRFPHWWARCVLVTLVTTGAYYLAVAIQQASRGSGDMQCLATAATAGLVGAGISGLAVVVATGMWRRRGVLVPIIAAGGTMGLVFGLLLIYVHGDQYYVMKLTAGYVLWQSATALPLGRRTQ